MGGRVLTGVLLSCLAGCLVTPDKSLLEREGGVDQRVGLDGMIVVLGDQSRSDQSLDIIPSEMLAPDAPGIDTLEPDLLKPDSQPPVPPPNLKGVRSGSTAIVAGSASVTVPLTPALDDLQKTVFIYQVSSNDANPQNGAVRCLLASKSSISCDRVGTVGQVEVQWYAAEFVSGVNVQHLQPTCNAGGTTTATITAVDPQKTFVLSGHRRAGSIFDIDDFMTVRLAGPTTVEIVKSDVDCSSEAYALQVVEMDQVMVTRGLTSAMSGASLTVSGQPSSTLSRTFLLYSWRNTVTGTSICDRMVRGTLASATSITFTRGDGATGCAGGTIDAIAWQRVRLWSGAKVQPLTVAMAAGVDTEDVTLSPTVDTSRAVVFAGGQGEQGQAMGEGTFATNDIIGTMSGRHQLVSSSQVQVKRANSGGSARWTSYVVEF